MLLPLWPADEHLRGCWLLLLHKCAGRPEAIKNNPIGTCDARLKGNTARLTSKHAGGGVAPLAAKQRIRITTNVKEIMALLAASPPTSRKSGDATASSPLTGLTVT